ncbi:MAG: hypothetical protein RI990_731, partial [Planctomycetota bacterium]
EPDDVSGFRVEVASLRSGSTFAGRGPGRIPA